MGGTLHQRDARLGTVFFSGCPLRCCFCQNYRISAENFGKEISVGRLAEIFLELQAQGAHNLNLVNPTHWAPWVVEAVERARPALKIPVVCNSGGYESPETLELLGKVADVWLPDLKYADAARAARYSGAPDYFRVASSAIAEMFRQTGTRPVRGGRGCSKRGSSSAISCCRAGSTIRSRCSNGSRKTCRWRRSV